MTGISGVQISSIIHWKSFFLHAEKGRSKICPERLIQDAVRMIKVVESLIQIDVYLCCIIGQHVNVNNLREL